MAQGWKKRRSHKAVGPSEKKQQHIRPRAKKMQREATGHKRKADDMNSPHETACDASGGGQETRRCRPRGMTDNNNTTTGGAPAIRHMVNGNLLAFADPFYQV